MRRVSVHARRARGIARRYFVTNGFDGALTMLGLLVGFHSSAGTTLPVALKACVGAALALCVSGLSSAYLSESAERRKELLELENALLADLQGSDYGLASRYMPVLVALVNGLSPFLISMLILAPLWLVEYGVPLPCSPYTAGIMVAFAVLFLLGVLLGRLSRQFWLWTGLRTLLIAMLTAGVVYVLNP